MKRFNVLFLDPAKSFLEDLGPKAKEKVLFNIWKARQINDPGIFKKLSRNIWEFRIRYQTNQIRFMAFWDRRQGEETVIVITHGFFKKSQKIHIKEMKKAEQVMKDYMK